MRKHLSSCEGQLGKPASGAAGGKSQGKGKKETVQILCSGQQKSTTLDEMISVE